MEGIETAASPQGAALDGAEWLKTSCQNLLLDLGYSLDDPASADPTFPRIIFDYAAAETAGDALHGDLLKALPRLLAVEGVSEMVARHFWPVCVDLVARWIGRPDVDLAEWERRLSAVAAICGSTRGLWNIATAFIASSPFVTSPLAHIPQDQLASTPSDRLHILLIAYYRILLADEAIASRLKWSHTPLHALRTQHPDLGVRLLAIRVLSMQRPWSEAKRIEVERECVGDMELVNAEILFGFEVVKQENGGSEVRRVMVDGWLLPIMERRRLQKVEALTETQLPTPLDPLHRHLSSQVIPITDRLFLRNPSRGSSSGFVHVSTTSTENALLEMAPLLAQGSPILLSSTPSSGKTHLLQHLSTLLHPGVNPAHRILSIPLADTTIDVKSLIGTYISSPTQPGTFEWMEGALSKAVRAGRWVILDDIDRASVEMLVTVAGIARSLQPGRPGRRAKLAVPGREEIEAGDGFALFATRSTRQDASTPLIFFGHHLFSNINLSSPTDEEVLAILSAKFDALPTSVSATLVRMWQELRPMARVSGPVKAREIGLRDLEKWCARVVLNLPSVAKMAALEQSSSGVFANPVFQDEVLLEAVDTFMASLDSKPASVERRNAMIAVVAGHIGMDEERAFALIDKRRPTLEKVASTKQLIIGRTSTPLAPASKRRSAQASRPFALTKPSLVLLERIAASSAMGEPTLLVGETATGKTTAVQYIADTCGRPLTALNLSMQTESSDLLGGFKPIDASVSARLLHAKWQKLFCETFSMTKQQNSSFLEVAAKALSGRKWQRCTELWSASARRAMEKLRRQDEDETPRENGDASPRKRRKPNMRAAKAAVQWQALIVEVSEFDLHHVKMNSKLVFAFVEGPLVKAMQSGEILLDEINLASQETLEAISTVLEGPSASLVLTERGDVEPVARHPDFRLFACMNPATDVGKKDLPPSLRSRFTEIYAAPPDDDREALVSIVTQYIGDIAAGDKAAILDVAEMYQELKSLSAAKEIVDGANTAPHYSMRTLARSLMFAIETAPLFGLRRALWEGCLMAFTMSLDLVSIEKAREVCSRYLLGPMKNAKAVLSQIPSLPSGSDSDDYIRFGPFWLKRGPLPPTPQSRYVITPSVQAKLSDLARVVMTHRYPVLIQGPTSSGKTSAVEFLARQTGHRFVRINNHEHTDIQEYLGTYVTDPKTGNLVFQEGLLVTAVRQGHWIVLDELNLAPTDVLEALNRLLDDNRELVIPETQEVVRPHPNFILFATQNPPGLYAGRKVLSRAFRNRFLEVHFDDVPKNELETIICQRCQIAPSYAKKIVQVFEELRHRRQASRVFESKQSFATLRDLFRWAERGAVGYQALGSDGYMLLAERGRQEEDKEVIKGVIEDVLKVSVDPRGIYDLSLETVMARLPFAEVPSSTLVWTQAMQRLFTLVASALANNEPVLLVGETGCGKTSICDIIALAFKQNLVGVNCHQNMETADLLGSQRPVRNRLERKARIISRLIALSPGLDIPADDDLEGPLADLRQRSDVDQVELKAIETELAALSALFEWSDGPLVHAMNNGDLLLLDEVSLADDSVLERLNSVLEPGRTLVLAEKGGSDIDSATIVAHPNFHVVATMNPGGDFGKKELSPALRNRFTEIWVPALNDRDDLLQIIGLAWKHKELEAFGAVVLDFFGWFGQRVGDAAGLGLRDILAWVNFMNEIFAQGGLEPYQAFHHGGQMTVVDGLESLPQCAGMATASVAALRSDCLECLSRLGQTVAGKAALVEAPAAMEVTPTSIHIGAFGIQRGSLPASDVQFHFNAPTTALNATRVLRACQLPKAILLEGSPGVGKTSLVAALAAISGFHLQRINLSDQTDLIDLFGSDLPVEGGKAGEFRWRDAAFLDAMQKGDWVLLDEMNLASQTVLEGLNAVLDYRGTVYIPELGRSFARHPNFRVFAAQNPLQQGGGRKGLPKSFLNRFTKVYLQEHTADDLLLICQQLYPMPVEIVQKLIAFNEEIRIATTVDRTIGREGSPWEFNLRDLFRWFGVLDAKNGLELSHHPAEFLRMIYLERFRNQADRDAVQGIFERVFETSMTHSRPMPLLTPSRMRIGHATAARAGDAAPTATIRHEHLDVAESVLKAVELGWLVILAGESGGGKRSLVRTIAGEAGRGLGEFTMHPGVDTSEILGSFEQQDHRRIVRSVYADIVRLLDRVEDGGVSIGDARAVLSQAHDALHRDKSQADRFQSVCQAVLQRLPVDAETTAIQHKLSLIPKSDSAATGFAWVDGQLIDALRTGGWYLISDANLCSPSVLDRLNSLCESNGSLILSEKGSTSGIPEVIRPHPDFRLFMTYDPRFGELSRAMRNRGIELYLQPSPRSACRAALSELAVLSDSLLRSAWLIEGVDVQNPSAVANGIAGSVRESLSHLARLIRAEGPEAGGSMLPSAVDWAQANAPKSSDGLIETIDPVLNPTLTTGGGDDIFRAILITLRIQSAQGRLQHWLEANGSTKAVLSQSAASNAGRKSKRVAAGAHVYSLLVEMRTILKDILRSINPAQPLESIDRIELLLLHLEDRCKSDSFDYSAVGLIAEWLGQELQALDSALDLERLVAKSIQHVQTTTGQGQSEIWSMFRSAFEVDGIIPADLLEMADRCKDSKLRQMLLSGLVALQSSSNVDAGATALREMLRDMGEASAQVPAARWTQRSIASIIELHAASRDHQLREGDLHLILTDSAAKISDLLPLASLGSEASIADLKWMSAWLRRTWQDADEADTEEVLGGPARLFGPAQLLGTLRFDSADALRLDQISDADNALSFSIRNALWSTQLGQDRGSTLLSMLLEAVRLLLSAFAISCPREGDVAAQSAALVSSVRSSPVKHVRQAGESHLLSPLTAAAQGASDTSTIGQLCLGISRFLLDTYVTSVPMDPAVRRVLSHELLISRIARLNEELEAIESMEIRIKGISDSTRRFAVITKIEQTQALISNLGPSISRTSDPARLAYLFNEVHSFLGDVYSETSAASLVNSLAAGDLQALHREQSFQLAAESFLARLGAVYADLDDLVQPIITAVLFARFGLRTLAREPERRQARSDPVVSTALVFPRAAIIPHLQSSALRESFTTNDLLIASFAHAAETTNPTQRSRHTTALLAYLGGLYSKWSETRMQEQQDEQAKESLYRVKKTEVEVLSDLEQEEQEFTELFPQYEVDEEGNSIVPPKAASEGEEQHASFPASAVEAFHALVSSLFGGKHSSVAEQLADLLRHTVRSAFDPRPHDELLDAASLSWQLETLHRRLAESRKPGKTPNFYLGANEPESRKAAAIAARLRARLDVLVDEWPEQMILQHIRDRCDRFLSLDIRSPVAMTLTNLEQLLIHIDDWEPYASRDNSLKSYQAEISALLIDWRRLELSSWVRLLDDQTSQYVARDAEWTLRLFGALISGSTSSTDLTKHFASLVPMITTYLQTSTLGNFPSRLAVLDCFRRMAGELSLLPGNDNLGAVHSLLSNIVNNARLFITRIEDSVRTQRAVIDKAIKDFVKLASWKDVNIFALRASAQKSHKQLHRNIRKFRDVLQQPVAPMLSDLTAVVPQISAQMENASAAVFFDVSVFPTSAPEGTATTPAHLLRLPETLARFSNLLSSRSAEDIERVGGAIDAMAVDIIETAAELASATPASLTKENTKAIANLQRRKRKAYSDLLKSLRASGFSQSVRADSLAKQQSSAWMLQRSPLHLDTVPDGLNSVVRDVEKYDVKLGVLLPALRAAFNGHNDDIASQDLQRGIGFTESVLASCLTQRERLATSIQAVTAYSAKIAHIRRLAQASTIEGGQDVSDRLVEATLLYCRLKQALVEAQESIRRHRDLEEKAVSTGDLAVLQDIVTELDGLIPKLDEACASARAASYHVFSSSESTLLRSADDIRSRAIAAFDSQLAELPAFTYLFKTLLIMTTQLPLLSTDLPQANLSPEIRRQSEDLISSILVVAQSLPMPKEMADTDEPPHIPQSFTQQSQRHDALRIPDVIGRLDSLMGAFTSHTAGYSVPFGSIPLAQALPFLETLGEQYAQAISQHAYAVKSTYKLCYVVGRIMLDLAQKGFCKPQEESKSKDGEGEETVEGTGMGTGTGDKNVSSEIEEEGQVEGLQGEKEEDKEDGDDDEGDDDAVDMEDDFDGDLGEGKEKKEDEGEDGEEEDEEDHDEHAGDVDPLDPGAVDEKFWGEEEQKVGKEQGKDEVMDQQAQDDGGETEMTAKEEESKKQDEKKKDQKEAGESADDDGKQQEMPEDGGEGEGDEQEEDDREGEDDNDDTNPPKRPEEQNVNVDEGERLDLPEDINLDGDDDENNDNGLDGEDDISLPPDERGEDEEMGEGDDASVASQDDGAAEDEAPDATGVGEEDVQDQEEAVGQNVDVPAANDADAQDSTDLGQGQGGSAEDQPKEKEVKEGEEEEKMDTEPAESKPEGEGSAPQDPSSGPADQQEGEGAIESSGAPIPTDSRNQPQANRSLGDILEDIRRRRDEILAQQDRQEEVEKRADAKDEAAGQVEYLQDGDVDEGQQALGTAGEEERQKLEDLNILDDDMEGEADAGMADEREEGEEEPRDQPERQANNSSGTADQQDTEKALTRADINGSAERPSAGEQMDVDAPEGEDDAITEPKEEEMPVEEVELNVLDLARPAEGSSGEDRWRYYTSLTSDLSYALCEQLRLILQPTLATRLQGDFRTGKRLNMRKIIPYIASEFSKDKIWQRRMKPSKRQYQILLCVDNSRSMAENRTVDLAFQALALVAQALTKLEVGQIGIASFGSSVDILHDFSDVGFTDAHGAAVMNSFSFDQQKTDVAALVERSLSYLAEARQSQTTAAPDLWQVTFIVSDGVCQDHAKLSTLLRRALEDRVFIVFIIIDQLQAQPNAPPGAATTGASNNTRPSILSLQTVEYKNVGGEMKLEMSRYLDTFPFQYYVVLRDVAALPGVLSDILRQWAVRVAESAE